MKYGKGRGYLIPMCSGCLMPACFDQLPSLTNAVLLDVVQEVAVRFVAESNGRYVDLKRLPDIGK